LRSRQLSLGASRLDSARAEQYQTDIGDVATHKAWKAEHKDYVWSSVYIAKDLPKSAESFLAVNQQAHLQEHLDNAFLLRLESLDGVVNQPLLSDDIANRFWLRFYHSQKDLRKDTLNDSDEALRTEFVKQWNEQRSQARPMFATFLNDFGGNLTELLKTDWPHILRDRLGLTHWPSTPGKALPVALMCYEINEVRAARALASKKGVAASFARPTVLDTEMSAAFIPAPLLPGNASYGYTLDLANTNVPQAFTPELLTFPIDYQPKHIKALGFITTPHALQEAPALLAARNRHVQGLQTLPDCGGFGELLT
jgi:hypothetical protein